MCECVYITRLTFIKGSYHFIFFNIKKQISGEICFKKFNIVSIPVNFHLGFYFLSTLLEKPLCTMLG